MNKLEENRDTKTQITIGRRQSGKTTKLIKRAAEEGLYILTGNKSMADSIFRQAKEMGFDIPYPLTAYDFTYGLKIRNYRGVPIKGILIDEAVMVLNNFLCEIPIREITLTDDDNVEHLYQQLTGRKTYFNNYQNLTITHDFVNSMYEKLDGIAFQTLCDFGMREYEVKVDKKELVEVFSLVLKCKECGIDISDLTDAAIEISEKTKQAYEKGYEDGRKCEKDAMKKALFPDSCDIQGEEN